MEVGQIYLAGRRGWRGCEPVPAYIGIYHMVDRKLPITSSELCFGFAYYNT
jgi:hypothetical protein